jgi:hypothetical protein
MPRTRRQNLWSEYEAHWQASALQPVECGPGPPGARPSASASAIHWQARSRTLSLSLACRQHTKQVEDVLILTLAPGML